MSGKRIWYGKRETDNIKVAAVGTGARFLLESPEKLQKDWQPAPPENWEIVVFINWFPLPIVCACPWVEQALVGLEKTMEKKVEKQVEGVEKGYC